MLQEGFPFILECVDSVVVHLLEVLEVHILHPEVFDLLLPLVDEVFLLRKLRDHVLVLVLVTDQFIRQILHLISRVLDQSLQEVTSVLQTFVLLGQLGDRGTKVLRNLILHSQVILQGLL